MKFRSVDVWTLRLRNCEMFSRTICNSPWLVRSLLATDVEEDAASRRSLYRRLINF